MNSLNFFILNNSEEGLDMLNLKQILKILVCVLLASLVLYGANWTHITVGSAPASTRPVICSDPLGNLHVAWTSDDIYGELVQYATNQPGSWSFQKQVAGSNGYQSYNPSITADQEGYAYIVYRYEVGEIRFVTDYHNTSRYWNLTRQMSSGHYHECSIEVDKNFNTHVFAQDDTWGSNVFYQNHDLNDVVNDSGATAMFGTTVDHNNTLHFIGSNGYGIFYTYDSTGTWSNPVIIDSTGGTTSITCDINNVLHIAYSISAYDSIFYLNNSTGQWGTPEFVTTGGVFPNVVADENGKAHIAYHTVGDYGGIYYTNNVNGSWLDPEFITTINTDLSSATEDVAHVESKIALDPNSNTVNIVYISGGNTVKVAQTSDFNLRSLKSTDTSSTLISTAGTPGSDTLSTTASGALDMLQFTISDAGGDGNATRMKQLILQRGPGMSEEICFNDIFQQVSLDASDGSSLSGSIYGSKILFGTLNSVWKEIPDNGSLNFTVSGTLKQPLQSVDAKTVQMKINGLYDIIIDTTGSRFDYTSTNVISDTILFQVVPDHFEFVNLGDDFYNENLLQGFWMQVKVVDANGTIATGVSGINITLSAVELDGVTPTALLLQSTEGLTKTLTNGVAQWNNLTYSAPGQIRILANCDVLAAASDTVTVMPFHKNLVISMDEEIKSMLNHLNIEYDFYHEGNYQFPNAGKIVDYQSLLLFPSSNYAWYIDSTKIKTFLDAGNDTAWKNILAFGEYGLGYIMDSPFTENYFGARGGSYFNHQSTTFEGVSGDPVTDGLSLSVPTGMTLELLYNDHLTNSKILTQTGTDKVVGVKNNAGTFRSVLITPDFENISSTADRDTLINRIIQWFQEETTTAQGPQLSDLPDMNITEDISYKMALSDWYPYVDDADTPDENLEWNVSNGNNSESSIINDTLFVQTSENFYGQDTAIVTVSDGLLTDMDTILITVAPVNDPPEPFYLLTPEDEYWTDYDPDSSELFFSWTQAKDIDSDSIVYKIKIFTNIYGSNTYIITDTSVFIDYTKVNCIESNIAIFWKVTAFDLMDSTIAENSPYGFTILSPEFTGSHEDFIPDEYCLLPNYPNPFNPTTTFKYGLPEESNVTITIYDINGRQIQTLVQKTQPAGYYSVQWNASNVGSGVFFYQIITGDFQQVRKCILIK